MDERVPRKQTEQPPEDRLEIRLDERAEPRKRHGDALIDGSGTRHGVDGRDERPGLSRREDEQGASDRVRDRDEMEVKE